MFIQTLTELLNNFIVLPKEVGLAHKNYQTTKHFSIYDIGYLFRLPPISPPVFTISAYWKECKETLLKGKWPKDSYTKADPNENVTKNL